MVVQGNNFSFWLLPQKIAASHNIFILLCGISLPRLAGKSSTESAIFHLRRPIFLALLLSFPCKPLKAQLVPSQLPLDARLHEQVIMVPAGDGVKAFKEALKSAKLVHEEYLPPATSDITAGGQRLIDKLKDQPGRKVIFIIWAGGSPFKVADLDLKRYGIEIATGGNILPAMAAYKQFPGMEGAAYYYFGMPKNPVNDAMVSRHYSQFKTPPDFFTAGGFSAAMATVAALKKTNGDTNTNTLIAAMEGMSFDTPKGKMTFRKEDHQAMQSMYHFKIKVDPAFAWGVPELVREIPASEMNVPIRNKR